MGRLAITVIIYFCCFVQMREAICFIIILIYIDYCRITRSILTFRPSFYNKRIAACIKRIASSTLFNRVVVYLFIFFCTLVSMVVA
jgi:hypothetical protein